MAVAVDPLLVETRLVPTHAVEGSEQGSNLVDVQTALAVSVITPAGMLRRIDVPDGAPTQGPDVADEEPAFDVDISCRIQAKLFAQLNLLLVEQMQVGVATQADWFLLTPSNGEATTGLVKS